MNLKPLLFALLLTATGCRRTTRSDDQADGGPPRLDYPRVVVGTDDSCLLDAAGYLSCWGRQPASHQPPKRAFAFVDLDTSGCGLARDGTLTCWPAAEMNDVGAFPPAATAWSRPGRRTPVPSGSTERWSAGANAAA